MTAKIGLALYGHILIPENFRYTRQAATFTKPYHKLSKQASIAYPHFRNVPSKVPKYYEVFLENGDINFVCPMRICTTNGYDRVMILDHTPRVA